MCKLDKKCGPCALKAKEETLKEFIRPAVSFKRDAGIKYKDPYFINKVWTTVQANPNISSSELWSTLHGNYENKEYIGDTRTFQSMLKFLIDKGYLKQGTATNPKYKTAWVIGDKPIYTVNAQTNTGQVKESKSLVESILRESAIDIQKYADVIEHFDNGLGMLRGIDLSDLSSTGLVALTKLSKAIVNFKDCIQNNTEMRDN